MEPIAYLNGEWIPASQACLPVYDAGVVLGATVSEWLRTFGGKLFRLDDHLRRLFTSLELTGIKTEQTHEEFAAICQRLVDVNHPLLDNSSELGLVIFITAGDVASFALMIDHALRFTSTVCVHTFPLRLEFYKSWIRKGVRLITPKVRQIPGACWDPRIKCRSRMHYYLAEREVRAIDPGATPLLLDIDGYVTETPTANFLMVKDGVIITPPQQTILPGISLAVTLEIAAKLGIGVREQRISVTEACLAEEAMLTSTPYWLAPVKQINDAIMKGESGPVYDRLREAWRNELLADRADFMKP